MDNKPASCEECEFHEDGKCYARRGIVYGADFGHSMCTYAKEVGLEDIFQPPIPLTNYGSYEQARREGREISLFFPGAKLTLDPQFCMGDLYGVLQDRFCNLMRYEIRHFQEN